MKQTKQKGFTLIELLVVIAIIAVLAVVLVLTLNPAELLKQARDSNRISDLNTLKSAISLYLADVSSPSLGTSLTCYTSLAAPGTTTCTAFFPTSTATSTSNNRTVAGSGWIPINFSAISSGAPIGTLPLDPTNNLNYFYAYISSSTSLTFKLAARTESVKFSASGTADVASTDGGSSNLWYETGTALGL